MSSYKRLTTRTLTSLVGELQSVDGYMNIALEQTKEFVDGKLRRNYGDAFVRGNNGVFESPACFGAGFNTNSNSDVHLGGFMSIQPQIVCLDGINYSSAGVRIIHLTT